MTQQNTATGTRAHGALASLGRALAGDADLGTRVGTALAGPLAAGPDGVKPIANGEGATYAS